MPPDEKKIRPRQTPSSIRNGSIEQQTQMQVDALLEPPFPARAGSTQTCRPRRRSIFPTTLSERRPPVRGRAVRTLTIETEEERPAAMAARAPRSFDGLPSPVRFALALALILLVTGAVSITKTYLAKQEERRRLEAEAAERARSIRSITAIITLYAAEQSLDPALVSAVILCESSFDPKAESRLGARG